MLWFRLMDRILKRMGLEPLVLTIETPITRNQTLKILDVDFGLTALVPRSEVYKNSALIFAVRRRRK
jgi:hypothetical protein